MLFYLRFDVWEIYTFNFLELQSTSLILCYCSLRFIRWRILRAWYRLFFFLQRNQFTRHSSIIWNSIPSVAYFHPDDAVSDTVFAMSPVFEPVIYTQQLKIGPFHCRIKSKKILMKSEWVLPNIFETFDNFEDINEF